MNGSVPLAPKDPKGILWVLVIGRVSTIHQNESNIEAGYEYAERVLKESYGYGGPMKVKHLGERGSGMLTDRKSIQEAREEIRSGRWDVVLMEDVSKPYRNPRWIYAFIQDAVDAGIRVIAPGDCVDSADENWEVNLGAAALRHGLHIPDTRRRVRRTATFSFHRGGMVQKVRFGYRKLTKEQAESGRHGPKGLRIVKLAKCTPIIREMKNRVLKGDFYEDIAEWLNEEGIAPGLYVKSGIWRAKLVIDLLRNPILSGRRTFREFMCTPIFKTGKHRREKNPKPETEDYPELAHLTHKEHDKLLKVMDQRAKDSRHGAGRDHPLYNKPRSRAPWPAQQTRCIVCGELMYRYNRDWLKCQNAHERGEDHCWNHVQVPLSLMREKVLAWLLSYCRQVPNFQETMTDAAWAVVQEERKRTNLAGSGSAREVDRLEQEAARLAKAIAKGGRLRALVKELAEVEKDLEIARKQTAADKQNAGAVGVFRSRDQVKAELDAALRQVANTSYEFAELMRRIIPEIWIQPIASLDGYVRPQAKIQFNPGAVVNSACGKNKVKQGQQVVKASIDLFELPLYIRHMAACLAEKAEDPRLSLKQIAARLGISYMTVKRSVDYARCMKQQGWEEPYKELKARPKSAPRWKPRS